MAAADGTPRHLETMAEIQVTTVTQLYHTEERQFTLANLCDRAQVRIVDEAIAHYFSNTEAYCRSRAVTASLEDCMDSLGYHIKNPPVVLE